MFHRQVINQPQYYFSITFDWFTSIFEYAFYWIWHEVGDNLHCLFPSITSRDDKWHEKVFFFKERNKTKRIFINHYISAKDFFFFWERKSLFNKHHRRKKRKADENQFFILSLLFKRLFAWFTMDSVCDVWLIVERYLFKNEFLYLIFVEKNHQDLKMETCQKFKIFKNIIFCYIACQTHNQFLSNLSA
jgi:hypothetical protein